MAKHPTPLNRPASLTELADVFNREGDLPTVLIGVSYLEQCLVLLLSSKMIDSSVVEKLLSPDGALGTLQAKADAAYCLMFLGKGSYQDVSLLGRIRNSFAHTHFRLGFESPAIAPLCDSLSTPQMPVRGPDGTIITDDKKLPAPLKSSQSRRDKFCIAVIAISEWIHQSVGTINQSSLNIEQRH